MTTEQAAHQMELVTEFLHDENEEARTIPGPYEQGANLPGPYEQGANQIRRDTMRDLFGVQYFD